ncbi:MAG: pro-sigmaK processing inhibitor BofA family protein [Clostridia bacterium]|nr:pro-sigmaK processing inhibitor BofA family protein [Clostridia bacterium]
MGIQITTLITYILGIIILFFVARFLVEPLKILFKVLYKGVIGFIVLSIINAIGGLFSFHIAVNVVTLLIVGFLGVPGVILLILLKYILKV